MALNIDDAIRIDKGNYSKVYIFKCQGGCDKELRVVKRKISSHSGKCIKCVKRTRHKYQTIYNGFLSHAKRRNRQVSLTFEEFCFLTEIKSCCYCGAEVKWNEYKGGPFNLDRKNPAEGYYFDNVVVCCYPCNFSKNNHYSQEEFIAITKLIKLMRSLDKREQNELLLTIGTWNDIIIYQ